MSCKPMMVAKLRAAGASEVVQHGASWKEADAHLREVIMKGDEAVYVHPFDHPDVWAGHSSIVKETKAQWEKLDEEGMPDAVVCSVGGGGLFIGIVQGLEEVGWDQTTILALETAGADSLAKSVEADEHLTLPGITSKATSLGATRVAEKAFQLARQHKKSGKVRNHVLGDAEAAMGSWRFADDERFLVELACGVNLALCYDGRLSEALGRPVSEHDRIVIVVCGGSNVDTYMVETWRQEYGLIGRQTNGKEIKQDINGDATDDVPSAMNA